MADPQVIQQTQTTIPEYARRYVEDLLGVGAGSIYNYQRDAQGNIVKDASGMPVIAGFNPYMQYTGERFAQFNPLQQQAFEAAGKLAVPEQMYEASQMAKLAAERAGNTAYTPYDYKANQVSVDASKFVPPEMRAAQMDYAPSITQYQMGPAERVNTAAMPQVSTRDIQTAQTGYRPELKQYQMGPAERVSTQSLTQPGTVQQFMSPYMQNVVDINKREAQRQADIASTRRGADFAKAGAFGGARQAIENAEAQRNLATQMGDIQARGLQEAYGQATQQFNTEQQARLAAQQANQQAGLTVGQQNLAAQLGVQQLGAGQIGLQTALANLNAQQQSAVQNEANRLQAQGMNAQQAMQAALANQQAGLTVGQQNLAAQLGTQQLGVQTGLQAGLANLNAQQQANVQNQAAQLQTQGLSAQQALQAALANQQAYQQAAQLSEQSRQYGAGLGLQGLQTAMQGAGQLGNLGQNIYGQYTGNINLQSQLGGMQQQRTQDMLNADYQDFLNAQNMPYKQLGFMSDLLRGTQGLGQQTMYQYQQPPSMMNQLMGLGTAAYGMSRLGGFKKGGAVRAGLADLAISRMA